MVLEMKNRIQKYFGLGILIAVLVFIDQFSKYLVVNKLNPKKSYTIIKHIFSFEYLENRGVAFGMLYNKMAFIMVIVILVTLLIIFAIHILENAIQNTAVLQDGTKDGTSRKLHRKFNILQIICAFLIAGSIGNLIDRIRLGYVIDFIKFDFINFPTFNIADCYVTVATFVLFVTLMFFISEEDLNSLKFRK